MLALALLLAALPAAQPVPPTDVGGTPEPAARSRVRGPAWVCGEDYGFALADGETAYAAQIGIHSIAWRVLGPRGEIIVTESSAFAVPEEPSEVVPDARGRRILRYGGPGSYRYMIWGLINGAGPEPRPAVQVRGPALTGGGADHAFLQRIEPRPFRPVRAHCRYRILRIRFLGEDF